MNLLEMRKRAGSDVKAIMKGRKRNEKTVKRSDSGEKGEEGKN